MRQELKQRIAQIETRGGVIEHIEMAEDIQRAIIQEMLTQADGNNQKLKSEIDLLGLPSFEGYPVVTRPAGAGVEIRYH